MRPSLLILIAIATVAAAPSWVIALPEAPGIPVACATQTGGPCKKYIIPETDVPPGATYCYCDAEYVGRGTVEIQAGATVVVRNATIAFEATSGGFHVAAGGSLDIQTSRLHEAEPSPYRIVAEPSSRLVLVGTSIVDGQGVVVRTSAVEIHDDLFQSIPQALTLDGVTTTVHDVRFVGNQLAVYQTGGQPTLRNNLFEDNHECVHDYRTDPDIIGNTFLHCIIGIWHEESHSRILDNFLQEDGDPGSLGIVVVNGNSPLVSGNEIRDFAVGISIRNARAFVRDNEVHGNGIGILIDRNSMAMDVTANRVHDNAGDGIRVMDGLDLAIADNIVARNGGNGISVSGGQVVLSGNRAEANAGHGLLVRDAPVLSLTGDAAIGNGGDGIRVLRTQATLTRTNASANGGNGHYVDAGTVLATVRLDCVRALGNALAGVENVAGLDSAASGWYAGNAIGVSSETVEALVDATRSYWGSATGPRHEANPTGTGDTVRGKVVFVPFAMAPPACG